MEKNDLNKITSLPLEQGYKEIPANANMDLKLSLMKDQVKKLRKSPDTTKMWGFIDKATNTEHYFNTPEQRNIASKRYANLKFIEPRK